MRACVLGLVASALAVALYANLEAAWPVGFVAFVPWLLALDRVASRRGALMHGVVMSVLFSAAAFWWFGAAIGAYTGVGAPMAIGALLVAAPLMQPQLIAFALARAVVGRRHGALLRALAGAAAWVGTEALWPKLLGDTFGHGLQPADALRQAADLGGAAGLTVLLLLVNEAIAHAIRRRGDGARAWLTPLALGAVLVAATAGYGALRLQSLRVPADDSLPVLRVAMVQASLVDYEQRRREQGSYAVVHEVLNTHFSLSASAVRDHGADALLWSETVYPTTFGQPRSADGAAFDAAIETFVDAMGVPLLFGTYERDDAGEYNAAVLLEPGRGRLASYRKTHPFPLTERVPFWLDGPTLRGLLPWTGSWQAGDGARVLPLRTRDGREVQVLPLICLDDVHPALAVDGARLGAQAIVGMSNDAWFTHWPIGARLHLAVAAFRSVETGLPQLRVTTNGMSAVIDETGEVLVHTQMAQQAVLTGHLVARDPAPTLMVAWGDWVGRAALAFLAAWLLWSAIRRLVDSRRGARPADETARFASGASAVDALLLTTTTRSAMSALRVAAALGLMWLAVDMATRIGWQVASLAQLQGYALLVLLPLLAAWALRRRGRRTLRIEAGQLVIASAGERVEIPLASIASVEPWRVPLPSPGVDLVLRSGRRWSIATAAVSALHGLQSEPSSAATALARLAEQRAAARRPRFDHALLKFGLFPLPPALVAFQLHQRITFGGVFGEWQAFGAGAWFSGLALWWGAWSLGLMLLAAALRIGIEATNAAASPFLAMSRQMDIREASEWIGRGLFYAGVPAWLLWRLLAN